MLFLSMVLSDKTIRSCFLVSVDLLRQRLEHFWLLIPWKKWESRESTIIMKWSMLRWVLRLWHLILKTLLQVLNSISLILKNRKTSQSILRRTTSILLKRKLNYKTKVLVLLHPLLVLLKHFSVSWTNLKSQYRMSPSVQCLNQISLRPSNQFSLMILPSARKSMPVC